VRGRIVGLGRGIIEQKIDWEEEIRSEDRTEEEYK
jgi:hypothetical protein